MTYASVQAMKDRYPEKDLRELTDETGQVINDDVIAKALADASMEIDGYLSGRYALPLTAVPGVLELHCCTIAMYNLLVLRSGTAPEDATSRYDKVVRFLERVSEGKQQLGIDPINNKPATQTDGPTVTTATRTFTRDAMKGFG